MKLRIYHILSDLFANEIRTLLCLPLGMTVIQLLLRKEGRITLLPPLLLMTLLCFVYTMIREYVRTIASFFLLHVLAAVPAILLCIHPSFLVTGIWVLYIVLEIVISVFHRLKPKTLPENASPFLLIPFFFGASACAYYEFHHISALFPVLLGSCILMYLFNIYMLNFIRYSHVEEGKKSVPYRRITSTYHMLLGIFALIAIALMFIARFIPLDRILDSIWGVLLAGIRFLIKLVAKDKKEPEKVIPSAAPDKSPLLDQPHGREDAWPLWEFLQMFFSFVLRVAIIVGIAVGIAYAIYQIYKRFYAKNMAVTDKTESLLFTDKTERIKRPEFSFNNFLHRFTPRTPSERIRKDFTRLVEKQAGSIDPSHTPRELLDKPDKSGVEALAAIYSQARYGNVECTKEDSAEFKALSRQYDSTTNGQ